MEKNEAKTKHRISARAVAIVFLLVLSGLLFSVLSKPAELKTNFAAQYYTNLASLPEHSLVSKMKAFIGASEAVLADGIPLKAPFNELYGAVVAYGSPSRRYISDVSYSNIVKTSYGQLAFCVYPEDEATLESAAEAVGELALGLEENGIDFEFVQLPSKLPPKSIREEIQLPEGFEDFANENADAFLAKLEERGVSVYDLRADFWKSGMGQRELFFSTDHHWSIEGAFLGMGLLAGRLNEAYGFEIPDGLYEKENFNFDKREDYFIGSLGRRTGRAFGGIDDFCLVTPNFDTDIRLVQFDESEDLDERGSFEDVVLETERYIEPKNPTTNRYAVYHGDYRELRFTNELCANDKKVLLIKDSFGLPLYSFLSLGVGEVRAIDLRLFSGNVLKYAEEYRPDVVILAYNCDCFHDKMFDFNLLL